MPPRKSPTVVYTTSAPTDEAAARKEVDSGIEEFLAWANQAHKS